MGGASNVRLKLANRAENVLIVRQALSGLAETVGLDEVALNDVSTALTEAANNVVLHAYEGGEGPLEVELACVPTGLDVLVGDRGCGILRPVYSGETVSDGIGLPVIQALSDSVDFRDRPAGGTEVAMHFELTQAQRLEGGVRLDSGLDSLETNGPESIALAVAPAAIARNVLPRVLSTLAARAYFTTDRISDLLLLADTLVAELEREGGGRLLVGISVAPRALELRIGPLARGRAGELLADHEDDGPGSVLDRLTDGHAVLESGELELLNLRVAQRD